MNSLLKCVDLIVYIKWWYFNINVIYFCNVLYRRYVWVLLNWKEWSVSEYGVLRGGYKRKNYNMNYLGFDKEKVVVIGVKLNELLVNY